MPGGEQAVAAAGRRPSLRSVWRPERNAGTFDVGKAKPVSDPGVAVERFAKEAAIAERLAEAR